jgi:hypothetical protein
MKNKDTIISNYENNIEENNRVKWGITEQGTKPNIL